MNLNAIHVEGWGEVSLGPTIARAGEGTVRRLVGHPESVAKIFHPDLKSLAEKQDKVAAMVRNRPRGAIQNDGFVVLTWPTHVLHGPGGAVGYVMPRIDTGGSVEIHMISNPSHRANPTPSGPQWMKQATWQHLLSIAANLCLAVQTVHQTRAVIGDFQERNILVSDTTRVTLVDCDSMQFTDADGRQYLCGVGRTEFTAPELTGLDLRKWPRQKSSDLFALAVHIHVLLMAGNHPFLRGNWTGSGEQPGAVELAREGHWAGGPRSLLRTHALAPPVNSLPDDILRLFARAFTVGARDPQARPSADEWRSALLAIKLTQCPRGHQLPEGGRGCPWCAIDGERTHRREKRRSGTLSPLTNSPVGLPPATVSPASAVSGSGTLGGGHAKPAAPTSRKATRTPITSAQKSLLWAATVFVCLAVTVTILVVLVAG